MKSPLKRSVQRRTIPVLFLTTLLFAASSLAAAPRARVASLLPYVSDAFQRMPGRVDLVATVSDLTFTAPAGVVDLGNPHAPNFEALASARPTLIIGDKRLHQVVRDKLARNGARVLLIEGSSVDATFAGLNASGEAAGAGTEMRALVTKARRDVDALRLQRPVAVLPLFGTAASVMAITSRTWLGDLLAELRFRNLAAETTGNQPFPGYVELSDESLAMLKPERVLLVAHGSPAEVEEGVRRKGERGGAWRGLMANLTVLPADLFAHNPGLRMADAARQLVVPRTAPRSARAVATTSR